MQAKGSWVAALHSFNDRRIVPAVLSKLLFDLAVVEGSECECSWGGIIKAVCFAAYPKQAPTKLHQQLPIQMAPEADIEWDPLQVLGVVPLLQRL